LRAEVERHLAPPRDATDRPALVRLGFKNPPGQRAGRLIDLAG
jgi:hypothetical protein